MGIIRSHATFYLDAVARGVSFARTLTLGRQRLYVGSPELARLAARYRPELTGSLGDLAYGDPADAFLKRFLGIRDLQTLDHSTYEGATLAHDLNVPIPAQHHEQYDAVIDSGTLEHVFNLPVAIGSCMNLVKRGGSLFIATPANNMCGHGFYQFSPELFFRLFSGVNGFDLTRLILVTHPFPGAELSDHQTWYDVTDPAILGARAPLMTSTPAFLMVEARRTDIVPVLAAPPLQSDYVSKWATAAEAGGPRRTWPRQAAGRLFKRLPPRIQNAAIGWYQRSYLCTLRNQRAFRRVRP
jgi:hypothetical protein